MRYRNSVYIILFFCFCRLCYAESDALQHSAISDLAEDTLLLDITQTNGRMVAVGQRGHILLSDNNVWRQVITPTQATLTSVFFIDDSIGWVTGHDAVILKTTDAGEHWELVYSDIKADAPLLDIWFENTQHGYAVGAYGYFLETLDGGTHWQKRFIGDDDFHLNQIRTSDDGCLYIAAEAGYAYRSHSQGQKWELLETPYQGSFYSVLPIDCQRLWLAGLRGNLYYSNDGGEHWTAHILPTESMLTDMLLTPENNLMLSGLDGTVLLKTASTVLRYASPNRDDFLSLTQISNSEFVLVGSQGLHYVNIQDFQ